MGCPLYKRMKNKGTSFYAFPSFSTDLSLALNNSDNYKLNFTKFVLLNIPEQEIVIKSGIERQQDEGKLNFDKNDQGPIFYNFQPGGNTDLPSKLSEQLIESLRNYVANYDITLRESRINSNTDFYNINEYTSPTEMIFWKWIRKLNLIDLEPALHKIDWDKNLPDFDNNNGTDDSFFRKYLWKERDVNYYDCTISQYTGNYPLLTINQPAKFKVGDTIALSANTSALSAETYDISQVIFSGNTTMLVLDSSNYTDSTEYTAIVYLNYNRLIQYIGEIQVESKVQTSRKNVTEITAHIPNQAGQTPVILFDIESNANYYPNLEMPILPDEQQEEILGAENSTSLIKTSPNDYPGTYYGYFDTEDKTYMCEDGDQLRYNGDYYGISLSNSNNLDSDTYFEKLTEFNSNNIDGLKMVFNRDHYLQMNLPDTNITNFDEYNSYYFNGAPSDFEFNAILWYYDIDDGSGNVYTNLAGIEFLNNPENDFDDCDVNNRKITPLQKLVSNGDQDGVSYIFNLNLKINIDNDVLPQAYEPSSIYNSFSFDLYNNILQSNALVYDNFAYIISGFTNINEEINNIKSLIYSQTEIDTINNQISTLNDLLGLYSTFQFVDSDTAKIETNFDNVYPTLRVNVVNTEYSTLTDLNISDVFEYNTLNSGASYIVSLPFTNKMQLNVYNDNNTYTGNAKILINSDLNYKQGLDIYLYPNISESANNLNININYYNGDYTSAATLISGLTMPIDLSDYDTLNPTASTYNNVYYTNSTLYVYARTITTGSTLTRINFNHNEDRAMFDLYDYVYIDNFYIQSGDTLTDYSGVYQLTGDGSSYFYINLDTSSCTLKSPFLTISLYRGMKINILRVNESNLSTIEDRYKITKTLI